MAVSTRIRRASALDFGRNGITRGASGTVDAVARADLLGLYAGFTYAAASFNVTDVHYLYSDDSSGSAAIFQILGSWSGSIVFEAQVAGVNTADANWVSIVATDIATKVKSTTTAANGVFRIDSDGLNVRARTATDASPTVTAVQRLT